MPRLPIKSSPPITMLLPMTTRPYPSKAFLQQCFDSVLHTTLDRVAGLTDTEYFWEPAPNCWSIRRRVDSPLRDDPNQAGNTEWISEWTDQQPERPTTIAWLITHMAGAKQRYHDFLFEGGERGHLIPTSAADAIAFYEHSHGKLAHQLDALDDTQLQQTRMSIWRVEEPVWWTYWVAIAHDMEHSAEIARLRELHRG